MSLLRKTWGEALVGNMGLNFILFLLFLPVILLFLGGVLLLVQGVQIPGVVLLVAAGVAFLLHMAIGSALNTIFLAALYQYAAEDRIPAGFDRRAVEGAFAHS